MSFVVFRQSESSVHGAMVFDAPDEWDVNVSSADFLEGRCLTEEGNGSWLIVDPDTDQWATILRRDDSPYNDCLPPSEILLADAFREESTIKQRLKNIARSADGGFFNPFNVLIGSLESNNTILHEQSFQSSTRTLSDGVHFLADHNDLDEPAEPFFQELDGVPSRERLETMFQDLHTPDGLREPVAMVEFYHDDGEWTINHFNSQTDTEGWTSLTRGED